MNGPDGKWIGLGLGDSSPETAQFKGFIKRKFQWVRDWNPALDDSESFDATLANIVMELQRRYGLPASGVVNYALKVASGFIKPTPPAKPVLFTVHGTGQPDPLGPGLPADTARACLDKVDWQPVGNYPATAFPMWPSIMQGVAELIVQINRYPDREICLAGYSQGAVVVGQVLKHHIMDPKGSLHHRLKDVRKVVFWGNPMRQQGIAAFDEWIHPIATAGTAGILEDRLEGLESAPFQTRDYAHDNDMYASCPFDDMGEDERAIAKIVMWNNVLGGPDSILAQIIELVQRPIPECIAMFRAIVDAGGFFTSTAHGYNIGPAIDFLRS